MARKRIRADDGRLMPIPKLADNIVKSAGRTLQILELFDNLKRPMMCVEIMEFLDLPQSSTSALLQSLVAMGYLGFDPSTHRYHPTSRVLFLGNWLASSILHDGRIVAIMQEIADRTGDSVALATAHNTSVRYLHVIQSQGPKRLRLTVGALLPIAETGSGLALLSTFRDDEIRKIVQRINAYERRELDPISVAGVIDTVKSIRRCGYYYAEGLYNPAGAVFAHVLPFRDGHQPLVLSVGSTKHLMRGRAAEIRTLVRSKVQELVA